MDENAQKRSEGLLPQGGARDIRTTKNEIAIEIMRLSKCFGAFHVLRDVSLKVLRWERLVVCGPSGGGKSTLLRCINRIEDWQQVRVVDAVDAAQERRLAPAGWT